jgi:methyltransferase (TIGR00027 family)
MVTVADTAFSIAALRAQETALPEAERLFEDPYAHLFRPEAAEVIEATQRFLDLPLFREGVRLRTRFIDDAVNQGIADGLRQVVIVGTGFDTRALRMPALADICVFEVDFADQLERKRAFLTSGGVSLPDRVSYVPCKFEGDFGPRLLEDLEAHGFRRGTGAMFVWEGVIGYVDGPGIDRSLAIMANAGGPGTRVVFTRAQPAIDPDSLEQRTERAGFTSVEDIGCDELWRRHLSGDPHPHTAISRIAIARM